MAFEVCQRDSEAAERPSEAHGRASEGSERASEADWRGKKMKIMAGRIPIRGGARDHRPLSCPITAKRIGEKNLTDDENKDMYA